MAPLVLVCDLVDPRAVPEVVGAKAANLAGASRAGLPTLPGLVLTTAAVARGLADPAVSAAAEEIFERLRGGPDRPLAVRSSSTIEDAGSSSMAGRFSSVLDVRDNESFRRAVEVVVGSAQRVRDDEGAVRPLAVLVQPQAEAVIGGVMFGIDPVTGERRHIVVDVVAGSPDALVSGRRSADHYVLSRRGRLVAEPATRSAPPLDRTLRRRLAALARRAGRAFGAPQDIEWLVDPAGSLVLLQTRPVTAVAVPERPSSRGILFGPGPVAETFPDPLSTLEADLWVQPLAEGIRAAVATTGVVSPRELERSPVVTTVDGWVAADLELLGIVRGKRSLRRRLSPTAIGRRLRTAWSVGRLRAQFPQASAMVVATVDEHLGLLGPLSSSSVSELCDLLGAARRELVTVHTYEVIAGMLLSTRPSAGSQALSAAGAAVDALRAGRARGWSDRQIIAVTPEVLLLVPPRVGGVDELVRGDRRGHPEGVGVSTDSTGGPPIESRLDDLGPREALRLRARWLQELIGRSAGELTARLEAEGRVADRRLLHQLHLEELVLAARGGVVPARSAAPVMSPSRPALPASFLWSPGAVSTPAHRVESIDRPQDQSVLTLSGTPAGAGRVRGVVVHDPAERQHGDPAILVVRHLDPRLAPMLSSLAGLVAETGSPLSHLAILAREAGVPTVVAVVDAQHRLPVGAVVEVDGRRGDVRVLSPAEVPS